MELLHQILLVIHITAGCITLVVGPIAIFYNFKQPRWHRLFGKIFFYAMLVVCFSAIFSYLRQPNLIFFQFLLGIACLVLINMARGIRSIRLMKGGALNQYDWVYAALFAGVGLGMLIRGGLLLNQDVSVAFPILFGVFGFGAMADVWRSYRSFSGKVQMDSFGWMIIHLSSMLSAFIASTTAFTVNAAHFLPWYIQWFGPTVLLVPINIYFGRKIRLLRAKKAVVS